MGSWGSISILTASLLGVWGFLEVLTSTGTYLVPQERFWDIHSITLALDFLLKSFKCLYAFGCHRELRTLMSCAMMCILQGELRSDVVNKPSGSFRRQGIELADLTDWACSLLHCCWQPLTLPPASLMDWDQQPIKPLWLPNSLVPVGDILFLYFPSHLFLVWWALPNNCWFFESTIHFIYWKDNDGTNVAWTGNGLLGLPAIMLLKLPQIYSRQMCEAWEMAN